MNYSTSPSLLFLEDANMLGFDSIVPPINIEESMPINGNMYLLYPQGMAVSLLPENHVYSSAAGRTSQKVPTTDEWENHRAAITRLYRDERKTLKEVITTMRQLYGFKATPEMYKKRISKWDIRRNLRWSEREDACRVVKQRLLAGEKGSKVIINGRERGIGLLQRHLRHPKSRVMSQVSAAGVQVVSPVVVTRSPQGYPSPSHIICQDFMEQGIQRSLHPTDDQREIESLCLNLSYLCVVAPDLTVLSGIDELYNHSVTARRWLRWRDYEQARLSFSRALEIFRARVCTNPVDMLCGWLGAFAGRRHVGKDWLFFEEVARNFYDLSLVLCGSSHPVTMVLSHISRIPDRLSAMVATLQAAIVSLEHREKPFQTFHLISWLRLTLSTVWTRMGSPDNARTILELNIEDCKRFGIHKTSQMDAVVGLLFYYLRNEWSSGAKFYKLLDTNFRKEDEKSWDVKTRLDVNRLRAMGALNVGNYTEAEKHYREIGFLALQQYGQSSPIHTDITIRLASLLRIQGRHAEAEHEMNMCRLTDDMDNRMHI
jgi:hypothetical protein